MKKLCAFIVLLSIVILSINQQIKAAEINYLPGGKNYLSIDNIEFLLEDTVPVFRTLDKIMVKPETDYVISMDSHLDTPRTNICITYFSDQDEILDEINIDSYGLEYGVFDNQSYQYYSFFIDSDVKFITLEISGLEATGIEDASSIQIEEGVYPTAYEDYIPGTVIDTSSPYFQSAGTIISYVDMPITAEEIKSSLIAYDSVDGDVSDNITLVNDAYSSFKEIIGQYSLLFSVSDLSGNSSEIEILVEVVDVLKPVFSDISQIEVLYPQVLSSEDILSQLSASDNYDGDISDLIVIESNAYTDNSSNVGSYDAQFSVSDSSGNQTFHDLVINVVDKESPTISGDSIIYIGYNQYFVESTIMSGLSVNDNYDVNIEMVVESNAYKDNHRQIGEYPIVFSATDSSGNRTEKIVTINVIDEIGPMIYFDMSIIQVYSNQVLELPDFAELLTKTNELKRGRDYAITVKYDSYRKNAQIPGVYHLKLSFKDEFGEVIDKDLEIKVIKQGIDGIYISPEETQVSFIEKYKNLLFITSGGLLLIASNLSWFFIYRKRIM